MENRNIVVLAIDDIKDNLISLKALVSQVFPEANVITANSGTEGLVLALSKNPDVILLDVFMPDMDGFEVCRKLKSNNRLRDIPVVFVTAIKSDKETRIKALDAGAEAFLTKPIDESELVAQLRAMLKIKEARAAKDSEKDRLAALVAEKTFELSKKQEEALRLLDALRESEARYKVLIETSQDAITLTDLQGKIIFVNNRKVEMLGYNDVNELVGRSVFELISPDKKQSLTTLAVELEQQGKFVGFITEVLRADGSTFPAELNFNFIYNENGKPEFIMDTMRDITERINTEKELKMAAEKWSKTFDAIQDRIAILDKNQNIIQVNKSFLDYCPDGTCKIEGSKCFNIVHQCDNSVIDCPFLRLKKSKVRETMQLVLNDRYCEIVVDPILDSNHDLIGAVHIISDITERVISEKILRIQYQIATEVVTADSVQALLEEIENKLATIADTALFTFAGYNHVSNSFECIFHSSRFHRAEEWISQNVFYQLVAENSVTSLFSIDDADSKPLFSRYPGIETCLVVPVIVEGTFFGVVSLHTPYKSQAYDEKFVALFEIVGNELGRFIEKQKMISDLVMAKERAEESDRLKSAFLANMSHEIRTPMNGILGFTDLLNEPDLSGEERVDYINIIQYSGNRMLNIINDLIDISKIEAGLMNKVDEDTMINDQLYFLYEFFKPEAEKKGLTFSYINGLPTENSMVRTDKEKIYAILTNLIKNALKYCHSGNIHFGYHLKENFVEFFVSDTGIGIPAERLAAIFDRFVQADVADKKAYEGAGLGLSISKAYVQMLGGKIWVESKVGEGSTFYFTIPYRKV